MLAYITLVSVIGLFICLSVRHFRIFIKAGKEPFKSTLGGYFSWFFNRAMEIIKALKTKTLGEFFQKRLIQTWTYKERWIFLILVVSFLILAASGFFFVLLSSQRIHGLLLLLHMSSGVFFAITLALVVLLRARKYNFNGEISVSKKTLSKKRKKDSQKILFQKLFFWLYVLGGLSLIGTALMMMLPYFSSDTQYYILQIHRYSALFSILSAMGFTDFLLFDRKT
ncbi:MAG: cytochrome b/b6 domain-containing protein [Candidatus Aminicenantaceae bacterium]